MDRLFSAAAMLTLILAWSTLAAKGSDMKLYPELTAYLAAREAEFDDIPAPRRDRLDTLAGHVVEQLKSGRPARLNFICTHNSRRSHMSQLWAAAAAEHCGLSDLRTYSGGTESTAFNPRAVAALTRAGFQIEPLSDDPNPVYLSRFAPHRPPIVGFSKVYRQAPNPATDYVAVMVCGEADRSCPTADGAAARIAIAYDDPKDFDDTARESEMYDERCRRIAREMLYVMRRAAGR